MSNKKITCEQCGVEFTKTNNRQKFCSIKCRLKYTRVLRGFEGQIRSCRACEKIFSPKVFNQKYCCEECRKKSQRKRLKEGTVKNIEKNDTLCWDCKNALGGCSWSRSFIPVEGWTAKRTRLKLDDTFIKSYYITDCPRFIHD